MQVVKRYFRQGVPTVDADSPSAPVQGLTTAVFSYDADASEWLRVWRFPDGTPNCGYKAQELSEAEYEMWQRRIDGAASEPDTGFTDDEGTWYPGMIGAGVSVIDAAGHAEMAAIQARADEAAAARARLAQVLTPRQAREALIRMGLDDAAEAAIEAIADPIERKLVRNWYEFTTEWAFDHPLLTTFASALGVDKDEFFAAAKAL